MEKILIIVPGSQSVIWDSKHDTGPTPAKKVYRGAPFKIHCKYAEQFSDQWIILSKAHGYVFPDKVIPGPLNQDDSNNPPQVTINKLRNQILEKRLYLFDKVVGLGGKEYRQMIEKSFVGYHIRLYFPFCGLPTGKSMQAVKQALEKGNAGI